VCPVSVQTVNEGSESCKLVQNVIEDVNGEVRVMQRALDIARVFQKGSVGTQLSMQFMSELFSKAWKYGSTIFAVKEAII
jgi:hypothetical protein